MTESIIKNLILEEEREKRKDIIQSYENLLIENIKEASQSKSFQHLQVHNIISILSKVDFSVHNDSINILKQLISMMLSSHSDEPETLQLLYKLKKEKLQQLNFSE